MTVRRIITCDSCGVILLDDDREVSLQIDRPLMSSIDPTPDEDGNHVWRSAGWDLCTGCAIITYDAIVRVVGSPDHDNIKEIMA